MQKQIQMKGAKMRLTRDIVHMNKLDAPTLPPPVHEDSRLVTLAELVSEIRNQPRFQQLQRELDPDSAPLNWSSWFMSWFGVL